LTQGAKQGKFARLWLLEHRVRGKRYPFIAPEGVPFLALSIALLVGAWWYLDVWLTAAAGILLALLYLVFRDPRRKVPALPLGVVSPVDGRVVSVELTDRGVLQGEAHIVRVRVNALGTYTARAPVEGKIMDLRSVGDGGVTDYRTNAMWIRTDEGDDVVLQFDGYRLGLAPRSTIGFGERVGQGQRCAYLRLVRYAEVHMPVGAKVLVGPGQTVVAGTAVVGQLPYH
jgi:phosphatidylserine decarboxylase